MRYLALLAVFAIAACGSEETDKEAKEVSESVSGAIKGTLEEAEKVEDVLRDAAAEVDGAIEDATGE